ncbi:rhodanese-like domain-containing protein [Siccirubricoccus sp. KC 17139]|uniref:Rhodanese-like domain-containing protein n=1 Tax=Siccirubricoccus soli TaxID=2899147 RepID=A0ABT1DEY2_9PROT|nr:rhodanese-like domain-containing protein [Siccirubricoccus soli]MCO6419774.1 rhodanese-like domain-containing protein [Siccirubricoccus soli]MCP2685909.1 rhodanese-like domain-containing protein [Siccirubricoccus soli]
MPTTVQDMLAAANAAVPRISGAEAKALQESGQAVFIDLREPAEIAASGKVPGALAIPRGLLEFRVDPHSPQRDPNLAKPVVVTYCASGGRAALAGKVLQELGYADVRNLGGFKDWVEAGGTVEKA